MGDLGIGERTVLKSVLKKQGMRTWTGFMWLWIATGGCLVNTVMNLRIT
jgi:hypothetical protein